MPVPQKIIKFLDKSKIKYPSEAKGGKERMFFDYEIIKHRTVYTAFDKAATLRVKPNLIGKTLILKTGGNLTIILIPANKNLDKIKFLKVINEWVIKEESKNSHGRVRIPERSPKGGARLRYSHADFASEKLIKNKLKGVKVGAVPPFGEIWKLLTFVDRGLLNNPKIIINAGNYNFSIKISPANLKKLMPKLVIGNFSKPRK